MVQVPILCLCHSWGTTRDVVSACELPYIRLILSATDSPPAVDLISVVCKSKVPHVSHIYSRLCYVAFDELKIAHVLVCVSAACV